ncbi:hypothetical protein E6H27_06140 [Candidatus Bathyarchaeota archaeon]|nr:MAG: hypothetical protein E6H27_06140 [Candidatus Bathyarchaeota archaeon]TMI59579.1 MAG: hypothetical protein E6H14_02980 [Candidatus Bathyarchaeota archaeon]
MRKRIWILALSLLVVTSSILAYFPLTQQLSNPYDVSWENAIRILNTGQVIRVFQTHHLDVTLSLKNETVLMTREPTIDAIFHEIVRCGDPCQNIVKATE